jgi:hypothetical protein
LRTILELKNRSAGTNKSIRWSIEKGLKD